MPAAASGAREGAASGVGERDRRLGAAHREAPAEHERRDGADPQLDRAVDWLLAELVKNPPVRPKRPAYPKK